ncbi:NRPS-like enzyme [Penicillium verhagenii]|uniref:NRPS-like enzyme n=1 Tax=Penicillium verhagenii TaxID=1562060 RepID=UPI002544E02E|nr:NRPS-like enzyme [Penicillium verhagenii]KAJ5948196.1 NRPS-like enzyme [Penicillium verhagenii]
MGLIHLSEQVQAAAIRDLPSSKLPPYHITGPSLDATLVRAHSFTVHGIPLQSTPDSRTVLCRFARFVGDVVGSERIAFVADVPETGPTLIQAAIPIRAATGVTPEPKLEFLTGVTHVEDVDFKILITAYSGSRTTNGVAASAQKGPFVLSVVYTQEDRADVTLNLRGDYGGWIAAKHLVKLAVAYLTSGLSDNIATGAGLDPSRVNFESFLQVAPQLVHKQPAVNGSKTNGHFHSRLLHSAFEDNVRRHPHNVAIEYLCRAPATSVRSRQHEYDRRDLTYAEVDSRAKELASELGLLLQVLGSQWRPALGDQYAFPLFISPSPELFLSMLAVLKSGHAFCSLPADAPPERLRAIVEDLGSPVVLGVGPMPWNGITGSQSEREQLAEGVMWVDITNPSSWRMDCIIPDTVATSSSDLRIPTEDDLCYLFYTSGSTGKPKGVLGSHRSALACVEATLAGPLSHLPAGPRVRWLNLSAPSFDPVIIDTFVPLSLGGVLCTAERDLLLTDVEACARELRATASYAVASLALLMRPERMPALKTLIVGGESVNGRVIEKFARVEGDPDDDRHLINAYGPTETTIFCTAEACVQGTRSSVIGDALTSAFFLMADPEALDAGELRETPLGLAGELIVGGPQVALGYLNRPDATAKAFIPVNAMGLPSGTTLYRTGDKTRVVWSSDGKRKIDFLGRFGTDQVKLNGRRVELTEIENVLTSAQGVASVAVVVANPKEGVRAQLVAFLTVWADEDRQSVASKCRAEAERLLPEWMCPGSYTVLDQLPYTPSGKVDRKVLLKLAAGEALSDSFVANGAPAVPERVAEKIQDSEFLKKDSASIVYRGLFAAIGDKATNADATTPLLGLGLDSLRTMLFLQSMRDDGIEGLALHQILSSVTINDLINLVEAKNPASKLSVGQDMDVDEQETWVSVDHSAVSKKDVEEENLVDVSVIDADDEEGIFELSITDKLRHFSHHCMPQCTSALNLAAVDIEQVLPATNTQTRILYYSTRDEFVDPTRYSGRPQLEHFLYDLPLDKLDATRMKHAVDVVLRRHDCFRSVFCSIKHPLSPFAVCILNKNSERAAVSTVEIVCKFDPKNASLWQHTLVSAQRAAEGAMTLDRPGVTVTWVSTPDGSRHVMILSLYHPIFDGVSLSHLREEITAEYAHLSRPAGIRNLTDKGNKLAFLPMRNTIELLFEGTDWVESMFYWMKRFAGVSSFRFGSTQPASQAVMLPIETGLVETHMRTATLRSSLSMDDLSNTALSHLSTSMAAVVQAAWASVLAQTRNANEGKLDVQFGSILHGRNTPDLWRCMAPLLTTVPMHLVLQKDEQSKNPTNREICRLLAAQHADVAPFIDVPCPTEDTFEMGADRFDTALNLQAYRSETATSSDAAPRDLPGWSSEQNLLTPYKEVDIGFPIMMEVWPAFGPEGPDWSGKMTLKCVYNVRKPGYEFLNEKWVAGMVGAFEDSLLRLLREPEAEYYVG